MDFLSPELFFAHWPFVVVAALLTVVGRVADRVFTRERAYETPKKDSWFWLRETLPLHPVGAGALIGAVMGYFGVSPEPAVTSPGMIALYYTGAGVAGLVGWVYARANAKSIPLPGESQPPPP